MLRKRLFVLVLLFSIPALLLAQNQPFSRMDVFDLQWVQDPQISPDGDQIVYVRRGMDIMKDSRTASLWMINADGTGHHKLTNRSESESSPAWSPSGDRIAFTSSEEDHGSELFIYWVDSGKTARISQLERSPGGLSWSPDGNQIAFSMKVPEPNQTLVTPPSKPDGAEWADVPRVTTRLNYEQDGSGYIEPGFSQLFVVNADGGAVRQLTDDDYHNGSQPRWTPDGEHLLFSANRRPDWERNYRNSEIYSLSVDTGEIRELTDRNGPDYSPKVSPEGETIAYLGYEDRVQTYQLTKLWLMDRDGSNRREIQTGLDRSLSDISWSSDGAGIYFMYDDEGVTKIGFTELDGDTDLVAENVGGTTIGRPYGGGSYSISDDDQIAFTLASTTHPAELALVEMGDEAEKITILNEPLFSNRSLGEVEEIWYQSSVDGRDIQGWIVTPPNYEPNQTYPLLVENHGGPISNYGERFSAEVQLYASAGYVVFYPNPRGSTGYGEEFGNLLYHDYPGDDYHDVMDGVDVLIERGITSEDSLYVTGGSAGGIMTAWMIGKNDRFEAAAVVKPVMNWISKTLSADNYYGYANYRYPGQPWENFEEYWSYSPISLVGNVETPTLVMVGTDDLRTPPSEAKQLYSALKIRDIETAYVEIPGASHSIASRPSQLITKVDHVLAWFEKYRE
ncbi:MAG: prolyl oligopeptidase family serine peptidase [Bacteroidetes bacterium]|jgi:dipeptidyl aminopeptidase/acylaminoacyl peptidase|nr:prolyl oligopeptidase family serine peptidase [Bacteroidota bacterium]